MRDLFAKMMVVALVAVVLLSATVEGAVGDIIFQASNDNNQEGGTWVESLDFYTMTRGISALDASNQGGSAVVMNTVSISPGTPPLNPIADVFTGTSLNNHRAIQFGGSNVVIVASQNSATALVINNLGPNDVVIDGVSITAGQTQTFSSFVILGDNSASFVDSSYDPATQDLYICQYQTNPRIVRYNLVTGATTTFPASSPQGVYFDPLLQVLIYSDSTGDIFALSTTGSPVTLPSGQVAPPNPPGISLASGGSPHGGDIVQDTFLYVYYDLSQSEVRAVNYGPTDETYMGVAVPSGGDATLLSGRSGQSVTTYDGSIVLGTTLGVFRLESEATSTFSTVRSDPHFTGFSGQEYDFHGIPNSSMAIFSDLDLQINAFVEKPLRPQLYRLGDQVTIMTKIGILFADIGTLEWGAYPDPSFTLNLKYDLVDGEYLLPDNSGSIRFIDQMHSGIEIRFAGRYVIVIQLVQDTINPDQRYIDFKMKLIASPASEFTHGVLGQTLWHNNVMSSTGMNGEGLVDGVVDDYVISELLTSDFSYTAFEARMVAVESEEDYVASGSSSESLVIL